MITHTSQSLETTTWVVDPERTSVEFNVENFWGMTTVKGRFSRYHGRLDLSGEPAVELTIEADSLDTGNQRRDTHLRSPAFFGAEQHPYVRFVSDRAALDGDRLRVHGHLYARGAGIPLDIDATVRRAGDELEVQALTDADHRRLGMTWSPLGMLRSPATLVIKARLVRR